MQHRCACHRSKSAHAYASPEQNGHGSPPFDRGHPSKVLGDGRSNQQSAKQDHSQANKQASTAFGTTTDTCDYRLTLLSRVRLDRLEPGSQPVKPLFGRC